MMVFVKPARVSVGALFLLITLLFTVPVLAHAKEYPSAFEPVSERVATLLKDIEASVNSKDAIALAQKALSSRSAKKFNGVEKAEINYFLGYYLFSDEQYDQSISHLKTAIPLFPAFDRSSKFAALKTLIGAADKLGRQEQIYSWIEENQLQFMQDVDDILRLAKYYAALQDSVRIERLVNFSLEKFKTETRFERDLALMQTLEFVRETSDAELIKSVEQYILDASGGYSLDELSRWYAFSKRPRLENYVYPEYSRFMLGPNNKAYVLIDFEVDHYGRTRDLKIIYPNKRYRRFEQASIKAAKLFRYRPAVDVTGTTAVRHITHGFTFN